ncbi:hypothetical protein WA026_007074 [Henosepilachna vigintioctopunctata]|uniref:Uncharacterized protein n=1 Tax=Henosepilachna vigintioctopunctata TaxID=420089 RepID=A0AAW1V8D7_9CUCU
MMSCSLPIVPVIQSLHSAHTDFPLHISLKGELSDNKRPNYPTEESNTWRKSMPSNFPTANGPTLIVAVGENCRHKVAPGSSIGLCLAYGEIRQKRRSTLVSISGKRIRLPIAPPGNSLRA